MLVAIRRWTPNWLLCGLGVALGAGPLGAVRAIPQRFGGRIAVDGRTRTCDCFRVWMPSAAGGA